MNASFSAGNTHFIHTKYKMQRWGSYENPSQRTHTFTYALHSMGYQINSTLNTLQQWFANCKSILPFHTVKTKVYQKWIESALFNKCESTMEQSTNKILVSLRVFFKANVKLAKLGQGYSTEENQSNILGGRKFK